MSSDQAIRYAYGEELALLGEQYPELVVLDADVAHSTRSVTFGEKYPDRFYNVGINEANMVSMAAGLAATGCLPVVNTFSFLLCERALDQIRSSVAYNGLNVKFAAGYGGLSDSFDGSSHHSITDLSVIRAVPGMTLVVLSDAVLTQKALRPILDFHGPVYFRLCRAPSPDFHPPDTMFQLGKALELKKGMDITIAATGIPVYFALKAAEMLETEGIQARVLEIHTLKPIDSSALIQAAKETGAVLTCEESNILGGLGGAVAEVMAKHCPVPMDFIGINDCYTPSGEYHQLLAQNGISAENMVEKAKALVEKKKGWRK